MGTQKIHQLATAVADLILNETESHQLLLPEMEVELCSQLTADDDDPNFSGCTGEHRSHVKQLREEILRHLLGGVGIKAVARKVGVSPQTVRAVKASVWTKARELDPIKQRLGRDYLASADLLRAEALERIDEIPAHVLLLASAQAADKGQLLTGGATQRIERPAPPPSDLNDLINALPVEAVPVESQEEAPQKASLGDGVRPALPAPDHAPSDALSDASPAKADACGPVCGPLEVSP